MGDQYRNIELERMFQDLGRALEANEAKRAQQQSQAAPQGAPPPASGVPTARFADVGQPPTARFPDANPPGVQQAAPMTIAAGQQPRPQMTPEQQALAGQIDAIPGQVAQGMGGPSAIAGGTPAGLPGQVSAIPDQVAQGMGGPAQIPQIQPVDTAGLDAYARMQRGGY